MTANKEITVAAWIEPPRPIVPEGRGRMRFLPPALIGVLGTLALHTLALETAFLASRAYKIRAPEVQEPASANDLSAASSPESLVFIYLPKVTSADNGIDQAIASMRATMKEHPIPVDAPDPSPPLEVEVLALSEDKPSVSPASGDGTDRARLFGMYTGQIQARVERIWRRPRTPVNEATGDQTPGDTGQSFQCQVQIVQDATGNVQEILLPRCNGTTAWQRSLVLAIQLASPLPAPPSATVFSHSVTLDFLGLPYAAGSPEDDYEIVPIKTMQAQSTPPPTRPSQLDFGFAPAPPRSPSPSSASKLEQTSD